MGRWSGAGRLGSIACGLALVVSCSPVAAGPELPRPAQPHATAPSTTVPPPPITTTTVDEQTLLAQECPTDVCLLYRIDPEARWSDGEPVTSADFAATLAAHQSPLATGGDPSYGLVAAVDEIDPKTVRVALSQPYGAWQSLFARVLPAHSESLDVTEMPGTGPFVFGRWIASDRIVLERNPDWWAKADPLTGAARGTLDRIEFVFIADNEVLLEALEDGEVDVASIRPDADIIERLDDMGELVEYAVTPGPFWEHIDFHHEDELLSKRWVRDVFELAIDRNALLDETVRRLVPGTSPLDNTIWMSYAGAYEPHYVDRFDPVAAEQLLIDNGCIRKGEIYSCDGREMSFVWLSTNDDPDRQTVFEMVRDDLASVGIRIVPNLRAPSDFVTRDVLFGGPDVWQLANFSWRAASDPSVAEATYMCGGSELNVNRYCSPEVESLVAQAAATMDVDERARLFNEADRLYLQDGAAIPLYQKPELMVWSSELDGPAPNFGASTDLWNAASWTGRTSVVVAVPSEPQALDPLGFGDETSNRVLAALLYGAFGMDPTLTRVPVLIESVEILRP